MIDISGNKLNKIIIPREMAKLKYIKLYNNILLYDICIF